MVKRYVDDLNSILKAIKPGVRYNAVEEKLELKEELVEVDQGKELDEITMTVARLQTVSTTSWRWKLIFLQIMKIISCQSLI